MDGPIFLGQCLPSRAVDCTFLGAPLSELCERSCTFGICTYSASDLPGLGSTCPFCSFRTVQGRWSPWVLGVPSSAHLLSSAWLTGQPCVGFVSWAPPRFSPHLEFLEFRAIGLWFWRGPCSVSASPCASGFWIGVCGRVPKTCIGGSGTRTFDRHSASHAVASSEGPASSLAAVFAALCLGACIAVGSALALGQHSLQHFLLLLFSRVALCLPSEWGCALKPVLARPWPSFQVALGLCCVGASFVRFGHGLDLLFDEEPWVALGCSLCLSLFCSLLGLLSGPLGWGSSPVGRPLRQLCQRGSVPCRSLAVCARVEDPILSWSCGCLRRLGCKRPAVRRPGALRLLLACVLYSIPLCVWAAPPGLSDAVAQIESFATALPEPLPSDGPGPDEHADASVDLSDLCEDALASAPSVRDEEWSSIVGRVQRESLQEAGLEYPCDEYAFGAIPSERHVPGLCGNASLSRFRCHAYVASPFYTPELLQLTWFLPCEARDAEHQVRACLQQDLYPFAPAVVAVRPQPSRDFAAFLAIPEWTTFVGLSAVLLDLRLATVNRDGPVIGAYLSRPTTASEIRREAGLYSMGPCSILVDCCDTPLRDDEQVFLSNGALVRLVRVDFEPEPVATLDQLLHEDAFDGFQGPWPRVPACKSIMLLHSSGRSFFSGARPAGQAIHTAIVDFVGLAEGSVAFHSRGDGCCERLSHRGTNVRGVLALADRTAEVDRPIVVFLDWRPVAAPVQYVCLPHPWISYTDLERLLPRPPPAEWRLIILGGRSRSDHLEVSHRCTLVFGFVSVYDPVGDPGMSSGSSGQPDDSGPDEGVEEEDPSDDHSVSSTRSRSRGGRRAVDHRLSPSSDHSFQGAFDALLRSIVVPECLPLKPPLPGSLSHTAHKFGWCGCIDGYDASAPPLLGYGDFGDLPVPAPWLAPVDLRVAQLQCDSPLGADLEGLCGDTLSSRPWDFSHKRDAMHAPCAGVLCHRLPDMLPPTGQLPIGGDRDTPPGVHFLLAGRAAPQHFLPDLVQPRPALALPPEDADFRICALVFVPEYIPEELVVTLRPGISVVEAIALVQGARAEVCQERFDRLFPARPQPSPGYAVFVAVADWHDGIVAVFDCTRYNGTLFSALVPPIADRASLLSIAGLSTAQGLEVYAADRPLPLRDGEAVPLARGSCVHFVSPGQPAFAVAFFEDMISSAAGWLQHVDVPMLLSPWVYLVTDDEPAFFQVFPGRRRMFRRDVAAYLGYDTTAMQLLPVVPRLYNFFDYGAFAQHVLIATQFPMSDPVTGLRRGVYLLDLRPLHAGLTWGFANGHSVRAQVLVDRFERLCPASHYVSISGARVRHEDDGVYFDFEQGQVLTVDFRVNVASSDSASGDSSDADSDSSGTSGPADDSACLGVDPSPGGDHGGSLSPPDARGGSPSPAGSYDAVSRCLQRCCYARASVLSPVGGDVSLSLWGLMIGVSYISLGGLFGFAFIRLCCSRLWFSSDPCICAAVSDGHLASFLGDAASFPARPRSGQDFGLAFQALLGCLFWRAPVMARLRCGAFVGNLVCYLLVTQAFLLPVRAMQGSVLADASASPGCAPDGVGRVEMWGRRTLGNAFDVGDLGPTSFLPSAFPERTPPTAVGSRRHVPTPCRGRTGLAPVRSFDAPEALSLDAPCAAVSGCSGPLYTLLEESLASSASTALFDAAILLDTLFAHFAEVGRPTSGPCDRLGHSARSVLLLDEVLPLPTSVHVPGPEMFRLDCGQCAMPFSEASLAQLRAGLDFRLLGRVPEGVPKPGRFADWLAVGAPGRTPGPGEVLVFTTDGAFLPATAAAGWALVCSLQDSRGSLPGQYVGCFFGSYPSDASCGAHRLASPNAYLAEVLGLLWAAVVALKLPSRCEVLFRADSQAAIQGVGGVVDTAPELLCIAARCFHLAVAARGGAGVRYAHVRGHAGDPANELADGLAGLGAAGRSNVGILHFDIFSWLSDDALAARWLPHAILSSSRPAQLPIIRSGVACWSLTEPPSRLEPGLMISPFVRSLCAQELPCGAGSQVRSFEWTSASFNALSLQEEKGADAGRGSGLYGATGRVGLVGAALAERGVFLAGIQEARTPSGACLSGGYKRYCSGCNDGGQFGVELWIASGGVWPAHRLVVLHACPSRLLARLEVLGQTYSVGVGHAPHRAHEAHVKQQWWTTTEELCLAYGAGLPWILLFDANCRLGDVTSDSVGGHQPDVEDLSRDPLFIVFFSASPAGCLAHFLPVCRVLEGLLFSDALRSCNVGTLLLFPTSGDLSRSVLGSTLAFLRVMLLSIISPLSLVVA